MINLKNKILITCALLICIVYCFFEAAGEGDFFIYVSAAGDLHDNKNIYEIAYSGYYHYFYSVLFASFLKLFYTLPFYTVKFFWLLLNFCLYAHLFVLLANCAPVKILSAKNRKFFLLLVFVFSFRFLHENIHSSQISIVILWCCVYGISLIFNGRQISGSLILALGINIKLLPIVFLPYLLYRGYFKAFLLTLLFYALSLFAPALLIGSEYNLTLLKSWWDLINPVQQRHVLDVDERSFHSLTTLLSTLLVKDVPDKYALSLPRNVLDISIPALANVILIVRLSLVAFTLYFLKLKPFVKAVSPLNLMTETAYLLLLIPLIFPHQQHYAFIFMVPAFSIILHCFLLNGNKIPLTQRWVVLIAMILSYLLGNLKILIGEYNHFYEHYKILTYSALLLIPLLVWAFRKNNTPLQISQDQHVTAAHFFF